MNRNFREQEDICICENCDKLFDKRTDGYKLCKDCADHGVYPVIYHNGNIVFSNFVSDTYVHEYRCSGAATGGKDAFVIRHAHPKVYSPRVECCEMFLSFDDAMKLYAALQRYVEHETKKEQGVTPVESRWRPKT